MATGFEALAEFEDAFDTATAKPKYPSEQSKAVPDGEYECEIRGASSKKVTGNTLFTFAMVIVSDGKYKGWALERTIFLEKKNGTDEEKAKFTSGKLGEVKKDFNTLGFDADNWTKANGRPFTLMASRASELAKGMRVKVRKKTNDQMADVYLNGRVLDAAKNAVDGKPLKVTPEELAAVKVPEGADAPATAAPPAETYNSPDSPIPF